MVGAARGYECIIVMGDGMSLERKVMLKALGAKLVLTPAATGVKGTIAKAQEIFEKYEKGKGFLFRQFENLDNPKVHRYVTSTITSPDSHVTVFNLSSFLLCSETTGPEIWYQTDGKIDIFISGVGTGGTLTGCSQVIRSHIYCR